MNYYFSIALILFLYMNLWFLLSVFKKRNDIADIAWGTGFVLVAWLAFLFSEDTGSRSLIVNFLVTIWGVRLALHIFLRNKGKKEDYRYQEWRSQWGKWFYLRSYLQVFILQGALLFIISLPVIFINGEVEGPLGIIGLLGIAVWLFGFFFETVGDWQLSKFIKDPSNKGKLMTSGLWAYTRHPNYFGEVAQWWGIWIIVISAPNGWLSIIGPLTITFLILKVSGIPMLEKRMSQNPEFDDYKKRTNAFIPWFPK